LKKEGEGGGAAYGGGTTDGGGAESLRGIGKR
jgi:hypothetical protein